MAEKSEDKTRSCKLTNSFFFLHKVYWPKSFDANRLRSLPVFIISVDGTHCPINEPSHPTKSQDNDYYSWKLNQAGLSYEIAMSLSESCIVWTNGPFKAKTNDMAIFKSALMQKIAPGMRVVADQGYRGLPDVLAIPNWFDSKPLRKFKRRASARQETINARLKNFHCMANSFRHGPKKHAKCFDAVIVILQLQLENGSPLFQI